jgi:aarF domain-containing kinase
MVIVSMLVECLCHVLIRSKSGWRLSSVAEASYDRSTSRPRSFACASRPHGHVMRCICPLPCTMRAFLFAGRQCIRQGFQRSATSTFHRASTRPFASANFVRRQFATPRLNGRTILWSGAASGAVLSPLAFVGIANEKSGNGEQTHEGAMLEASRKELDEQVPKSIQNSTKYRRGIYFFFEDYVIEPIATVFRFLHLVVIFVPVIVTIPAIWLGQRRSDKDDERSGTLWWYGFLVSSMERAGAAFIKVCSPFKNRKQSSAN